MEILVPVAIAAIGIGVLVFVLRRPTVVRPPEITPGDAAQTTAPEKPLGTIVLQNKKTFTTSTISVDDLHMSTTDMLKLAEGKGLDQLTQKLLKLVPDAASDTVPEARLAYPGSTMVMIRATGVTRSGDGQASTDYKTTFATEAASDQVVSWYQDWLTTHAWQPVQVDGAIGTAHDFARGGEHFRLTLADPAAVRAVLAVPIPDNAKTIYEVEYENSSSTPPGS